MLLEGQELDQVIGLIGVPRSGTTVITSFLAVHSRIYAVYEPWNAVRHDGIRGRVRTINGFMRRFAPALGGKTILLIKETFTQPRYVEALGAVLKTVRPPLARRLVVTLRNPFHVFLSQFEAQRKWWGHTDLVLSALLFDDWAHKTLRRMRFIARIARRFGALFVSYERFVEEPNVRRALMAELCLRYEPAQDFYQRYLRTENVRGDERVREQPQPISDEPVKRRTLEVAKIQPIIASARRYPKIVQLTQLTSARSETGVRAARGFPEFLSALS
jgi:hypothetical protein